MSKNGYWAHSVQLFPTGDDRVRAEQCLADLWTFLVERDRKLHAKKCEYRNSRSYDVQKWCTCASLKKRKQHYEDLGLPIPKKREKWKSEVDKLVWRLK